MKNKPIHISDAKTSNRNNKLERINNNSNPSNTITAIAKSIISTIKSNWLSMLIFTLGSMTILNYVPDANNSKALTIMVWTSVYCIWVMIYDKNKAN